MAHHTTRRRADRRMGFTLTDLLAAIAASAALGLLALPAMSNPRDVASRNRDAANMRAMVFSVNAFASDNQNRYPTPSTLDRNDATIRLGENEDWGLKNNTGNILSILIFQRILTPEFLISPRDQTPVRAMKEYRYDMRGHAIGQGAAQWDPNLKGTPWDHRNPNAPESMDKELVSNNSYAHWPVAGARRSLWQNTVSASMPVFSNRGPVYDLPKEPVEDPADWRLVDGPTGTGSPTLKFYGPEDQWYGMVAMADASVRPLEGPSDPDLNFVRRGADGKTRLWHDNIFVDEPWEGAGGDNEVVRRNAILRTFWKGIPLQERFEGSALTDTNKAVFIDGAEPPQAP